MAGFRHRQTWRPAACGPAWEFRRVVRTAEAGPGPQHRRGPRGIRPHGKAGLAPAQSQKISAGRRGTGAPGARYHPCSAPFPPIGTGRWPKSIPGRGSRLFLGQLPFLGHILRSAGSLADGFRAPELEIGAR